jgi:tetratricopeptide (TPR) repeat protein
MRIVVSILIAGLCGLAATAQNPIAQARSKVGDYRSALTLASRAPDAATANEQMSQAQNHLREAVRLFEEGGAAQSDEADILVDYADVLIILKSPDLAEPLLLRAATLAPQDGETWLRLGNARSELGPKALKSAIDAFDQAAAFAATDGSRAEADAGAAYTWFRNGYYDLAAKRYAAALNADAKNTRAQIGEAALLFRRGLVVDAAARLDSLTELPPDMVTELATTVGTAAEDLRDAGILIIDDAAHHIAYARILVRANRLAEALPPLEHAAAIEPGNTAAWNLMGALHTALGDLNGAKTAYQQSLALNPDQPRTQQALTQLTAPPAPTPAPLQPQGSPF